MSFIEKEHRDLLVGDFCLPALGSLEGTHKRLRRVAFRVILRLVVDFRREVPVS